MEKLRILKLMGVQQNDAANQMGLFFLKGMTCCNNILILHLNSKCSPSEKIKAGFFTKPALDHAAVLTIRSFGLSFFLSLIMCILLKSRIIGYDGSNSCQRKPPKLGREPLAW